MFEKLGRKFMKGAKAEILENPQFDWDGLLKAAIKIAEFGMFVAVLAWGGKSSVRTPTVINNYYIYKGADNK